MAKKRKLPRGEFEALRVRILAAAAEPMAVLEIDPEFFELDFEELPETSLTDFLDTASSVPPLPHVSGSRPVLIRIPNRVIRAFKMQAERTGGQYQTLMNRALRQAADAFV